jgi:hypothetical protein
MEQKDFDADEKKDNAIIKELLSKSKDYTDFAARLTSYFSKKYGAEFRGNVLFKYESAENSLIMTCYDQDRVFELCENAEEVFDIAPHLKFLRKSAANKYKNVKL